ncbi:MAG TPA: hypothetical protein PK988_02440, partial [Candidatus Sumerlaeota bacterium]|nr:hypothetical protein [Candidatus Sumerlaeota bacterium]
MRTPVLKQEQDEPLRKNSERRFLGWAGVVTFLIVLVLWAASHPVMLALVHSSSEASNVGQAYGALNTLFSGLAFAALVLTVLLQSQELKLTREEMTAQRQAAQESATHLADTTKIQALVGMQNADSELLKYQHTLLSEANRVIEDIQSERKSIDERPVLYSQEKERNLSQFDENVKNRLAEAHRERDESLRKINE